MRETSSSVALPTSAIEDAAETSPLEREVVDLFEQFRDRLLRYLFALGLGVHDSEEIVQEVFLALFQHLRQGKSQRNLRAWIFRVAHNLGLKQRYRNRQRQGVAGNSLPEFHADPGPNPEEQVIDGQRQARLRAVLRALPEREQWCLHLRAEGLTYRDIADVLEVSLGAVSIMLGRALARLRRVDR